MPELARFRAKHGPLEERAAEAAASILHVDMDAFFVSVELLEQSACMVRRLPRRTNCLERSRKAPVFPAQADSPRRGLPQKSLPTKPSQAASCGFRQAAKPVS